MDNRLPGQVGRDVLRILLLEDRDSDAELVERALRKAGFAYMFERARGEADFLARLDPPPHVIVADYYVPGCDALHALRLVRGRGIDVPFILVSGVIGEARALEAMRLGATDFLLKDRLGRLGSAIRTALELTALRRRSAGGSGAREERRETEFRAAFESATIGMALTTLDGQWLKVNPAFSGITGYTQDELQLRDCHSITHTDDVPEDIELQQRLVSGKVASSQREKRYIHKQGHPVWVHVTESLIRDDRRQPLHRVQQVVDISARRQTEARLARANRARKVMAECSHALVHAADERSFLQAMCRVVLDSGGYVQAYIGVPENDDRKSVRPVASAGFEQGYLEQAHRSWGEGERQSVMGDVIAGGRRFLTRDIFADPELSRWVERARSRGYQALICLPFLTGERCIGAISIYAREPDAFDQEEIELLEMLAQDICYGIVSLRARAELRRSEDHFRATFEQAAVGVAHTTTEGRFLHVNSRLCELLGYSRAELIGLTTRDVTHPDDRDRQDALRLELLAGKRDSFSSEKRYTRKDGPEIWVNRTVTVARPASGEPYLIQVIQDVSERKRTEARLARLTRAHRVMAECNHALIHASDETEMLQSMCRIVVDSGGYKMAWVGLPTGESLKPVTPAAHAGFGGDAPMTGTDAWGAGGRYLGFMVEVIASGEPHFARDILRDPRYVKRRARAEQHGFQSSIALPLRGASAVLGAIAIYAREADAFDDEEIALLTGLAEDIAYGVDNLRTRVAREQAERAARENERRLHESFEQAAVGISRVALDGVVMDVNQKFCDMLGYAKSELIGRHVREITHPEDFGRGSQIRAQLTRGTVKAGAGEKRFVRKDGSIMWGRRTMSSACDEAGNPQYVISVVEDITERKDFEQRFERLFEQAAVGMAQLDLEGRFMLVNQKFSDMLGYSRGELIGLKPEDVTHPDDRSEVGRTQQQLLRGEIARASSEKRFVSKDGRVIWVVRTASLARDAAGEPLYFIGVIEDITERKEIQHRFELTFNHAAVGMALSGLDGRYLQVNQRFSAMLGYSSEELTGLSIGDVMHPDDRGPVDQMRQKLLHGEVDSLSGERRYLRKDLGVIWVNRTISLARNAAGAPLYFITVAEDITETKQREENYRVMFENAAVGITRVDLNGILVDVNQKFCDLLGYTRTELCGKAVRDITDPEDFEQGSRFRTQLAQGDERSASGEKRFIRKDGAVIWARRTMSTALDEAGKPQYVISVVEDITERRRAEQALRQSEERYRDVFEASPLPMWIWDDATLDFVAINQAAVDHYGYSREEFLRLNVRDIWAADEVTRYEDNIRGRAQEQLLNLQRKHRTRDGRVIDVELTARRFMLSGRPVWLTVANDISERLRSEAAVRESEERFRATIENAPVGIMHTAIEDDRILQVNPQLCALVGYTAAELLGMTTDFVIHPEYRGRDRGKYRERMLRGEIGSFSSERVLLRKDGTAISVNRTVSLVRDAAGRPLYFIRILEDVTERTQSARRRAMEHAVTSVLAEAATVGDALPMVIRAICEGLDWACGFHWSWDRSAEVLRCHGSWHGGTGAIEEFVKATQEQVNEAPLVIPQGGTAGGLVRRVWASGAPVWLPDVAQLADFRRGPVAARANIHGAFAFPILAEGRPVGIMEFYSHEIRQPEQELLQILQAIGSQIGQFLQRKETEAALRQSEVQFRQLANNIPQVFWITDVRQKETLYVSPAAEMVLGHPLQEIRAHPRVLIKTVHPEDRQRVHAARKTAAAGGYNESYRILRPDGTIRWVHDRAFPVHDASGAVYRIAGIAEDITERKLAEERLMHLAHYDVLTSLPNRVLYYDRLRQALAQAKRNQWTVGVMLIDVDRFKNVNDTLGHAVGDRLLQQVSERLTKSVRAGDTVGRLGGDEFAVVLFNLASAQDANLVAQKIMTSFKEPFRLDGGAEIYVTGSIGITLYPNDSTDQDTLIKNADAAMYRAKEIGRNSYQFYTPEMNARALELLSMESSLRRALDRREFLLYYQPKVSVAGGDIVGVEALLRWRHPERGIVTPAEFMPVLEETGLIVPVGEWVLKAVCTQIAEWRRQGIDPKAVAINLSARQFVDKDLGPAIKRTLWENGIDPGVIELEITESSVMANIEDSTRTLEYLATLGVGLSIDDFGTGYSSLAYLKRFPLDALKVDRSFVRDVTASTDDAAIARAVITMAHSLGLKVIAEGVETQEQVTFLAEHGCDEFQGYFFSKPLPAEECGTWLRERRALARRTPVAGAGAPIVLLVDDDNDALTLFRRALSRDAYQILAAYSAQQGLELMGKHRVDVVISDQSMPGTPGLEFLKRVRAQFPGTMRILTSASELKGAADAVRAGEIFRFLPKGSSDEQVRAHVRDALQRRVR